MPREDAPSPPAIDALAPPQIAERIAALGVAKSRQSARATFLLGVLAGAYIALGCLWYTLVVSDASLGFAASRVLGGAVFSLGLILVVLAGAELFTGNNLLVMAWAEGRIGGRDMARHWALVLAANAVGAIAMAFLAVLSGYVDMNAGAVAATAVRIAAAKAALPFGQAFFAGVLCNMLVCLAVWLAAGGRTMADKVVAILFPIAAFVAAGFEHSIANFYFITLGLILDGGSALGPGAYVTNLVPVTLGNLAGGAGLVGLAYHAIYRRAGRPAAR